MIKKLFTIFTLVVLVVVCTTPALAQKPPDSNGKGNPTHENNGKGNKPDTQNRGQDTTPPAAQSPQAPGSNNVKTNTTSSTNGHGFDQFGYNRTARVFNGTGLSWCMAKGTGEEQCLIDMAPYAYDKLVMKWNAEWDRGNLEGWANPPYYAWENNQWNGKGEGGSGEVWHYKIVWVGPCIENSVLPNGGYCIWGQFEVLMDQGTSGGIHEWGAHAIPTGYGSYP